MQYEEELDFASEYASLSRQRTENNAMVSLMNPCSKDYETTNSAKNRISDKSWV